MPNTSFQQEYHHIEIYVDMGFAIPPGGIYALFIESPVEGVFFPDRPAPYSMLFHPRIFSTSRRLQMPPSSVTNFPRSNCSPVSVNSSSFMTAMLVQWAIMVIDSKDVLSVKHKRDGHLASASGVL